MNPFSLMFSIIAMLFLLSCKKQISESSTSNKFTKDMIEIESYHINQNRTKLESGIFKANNLIMSIFSTKAMELEIDSARSNWYTEINSAKLDESMVRPLKEIRLIYRLKSKDNNYTTSILVELNDILDCRLLHRDMVLDENEIVGKKYLFNINDEQAISTIKKNGFRFEEKEDLLHNGNLNIEYSVSDSTFYWTLSNKTSPDFENGSVRKISINCESGNVKIEDSYLTFIQ